MSSFLKSSAILSIISFFLVSGCGGRSFTAERPPGDEHLVKNSGDAARFLTQATFGPTRESIDQLIKKKSYDSWLDEQFNIAPSLHLPRVKNLTHKMCGDREDDGSIALDTWEASYARHQIWWETAVHAKDQLRQRVALALSEILVVSDSSGLGLADSQYAVTSYYDVLVRHAFGNFRELLEEVALHPAMGMFLGMVRNQKSDESQGIRPDENFARELMQLFTIGVHQLNQDGSPRLDDNGKFIATYNQKTIEEFARVFTGWNFAGAKWDDYFEDTDRTVPMVAIEEYHDTNEKTLLNKTVIPSGNTAEQDLKAALDTIFSHPNVAPFISRQLIQRLVKSNPSNEYIARVAAVFADNGSGVRGDLKAVIQAILLDDEARQLPLDTNKVTLVKSEGKLKEPLLRVSHLWRAFKMRPVKRIGKYWEPEKTCGAGKYDYFNFYLSLDDFVNQIQQGPLQAKSVFNFFSPGYSPPGLSTKGNLVAPEFQLINENALVNSTNLLLDMVYYYSNAISGPIDNERFSQLDLSRETDLAKSTDDLLEHLDLLLLNHSMSDELKAILAKHLNTKNHYSDGREGQLEKAREAIALIIASPEYLIQL